MYKGERFFFFFSPFPSLLLLVLLLNGENDGASCLLCDALLVGSVLKEAVVRGKSPKLGTMPK